MTGKFFTDKTFKEVTYLQLYYFLIFFVNNITNPPILFYNSKQKLKNRKIKAQQKTKSTIQFVKCYCYLQFKKRRKKK